MGLMLGAYTCRSLSVLRSDRSRCPARRMTQFATLSSRPKNEPRSEYACAYHVQLLRCIYRKANAGIARCTHKVEYVHSRSPFCPTYLSLPVFSSFPLLHRSPPPDDGSRNSRHKFHRFSGRPGGTQWRSSLPRGLSLGSSREWR